MFFRLLTIIVSASNHAKRASLNNKKCMTQTTLINLHHKEDSQELHYHPFAVNVVDMLEVAILLMIYVFQMKEILNLHVFNMITRINKSKTLTKHIMQM